MTYGPTLVLLAAALTSSVVAAGLPDSGSIEGWFYSHNVQKIDELQTNDGMKPYVNEAFTFHVGKRRGGLFGNTTERCLGHGRYSGSGAIKEIGRCTVIDPDGDKIFDEYEVGTRGGK